MTTERPPIDWTGVREIHDRRDAARALFLHHCQPGDRGTLERYGEKAAIAAIFSVASPAAPARSSLAQLEAQADEILRRHGANLPWKRGRGRDTWAAAIRAVVEALSPSPICDDITCNGEPCTAASDIESEGCDYCDGSGDVHRADGEWLGECPDCVAESEPQPKAKPRATPAPMSHIAHALPHIEWGA